MKLTLSRLVGKAVEGTLKGICVFCGTRTDKGNLLKEVVSGKFTAYSVIGEGNIVCEYCAGFLSDQSFRRYSWVISRDGVRTGKLKEIGAYIFNPPDPPFAIYLTKGGQKQGFLRGLKELNYSCERFFIYTDWIDIPVMVKREQAEHFRYIATSLLEKKVKKSELLSGAFSVRTYRKAMEDGWDRMLEEARSYTSSPVWEVVCNVI